MSEVDIAVSDALLGALALTLLIHHRRHFPASPFAAPLAWLLGGLAAGAWLGGIWHALYPDASGPMPALVWRASLLAAGISACGFARLGLRLLDISASGIINILLALYIAALLLTDDFLLALLATLPAMALTLFGFLKRPPARIGVTGLMLILGASAWQRWGPDLPVWWLSHNTVYHLLLMPALLLVYRAVTKLEMSRSTADVS